MNVLAVPQSTWWWRQQRASGAPVRDLFQVRIDLPGRRHALHQFRALQGDLVVGRVGISSAVRIVLYVIFHHRVDIIKAGEAFGD